VHGVGSTSCVHAHARASNPAGGAWPATLILYPFAAEPPARHRSQSFLFTHDRRLGAGARSNKAPQQRLRAR
jgi:hypothetical protein